MAMLVGPILICLLVRSALSSMPQNNRGCRRWTTRGQNQCCEECHPGNRLVSICGIKPEELCTPCRKGTYTQNPKEYKCERCTQCTGAQIELKKCTPTKNTQCGCKDGLKCGNEQCSFCLKKCGKGEEPTENRSCRQCPNGTFNDQIHHKCKPWRTKCPDPYQSIVTSGNASTDNRCVQISSSSLKQPESKYNHTLSEWAPIFTVFLSMGLLAFIIFLIIAGYNLTRKKKARAEINKAPIIRTATDDPEMLMATECSFHEAQEEQVSSLSGSLNCSESGNSLGRKTT
ncbi:tumor necrosis factor receptor superfamily member 9a [Stigmatopora nigra]